MGRKKIQIQRITDERNRQVRSLDRSHRVGKGKELLPSASIPFQVLQEGTLEEEEHSKLFLKRKELSWEVLQLTTALGTLHPRTPKFICHYIQMDSCPHSGAI